MANKEFLYINIEPRYKGMIMKAKDAPPNKYYLNKSNRIIWIYPKNKVPKKCGQNLFDGIPYRSEGFYSFKATYGYLPKDYDLDSFE